jgi:crossover junction endodeoxyribonuclease RuvC
LVKITYRLQNPAKIILGIDPGTLALGYGLIKVQGQKMSLIEMDVLKLAKYKDNYERLGLIHQKITAIIRKHKATDFAIEAPFFGKNVQSMLKLGRAQGVAIAAAMQSGIQVTEYSPKKVKQSITGNGNADKHQVLKMLQTLLSFKEFPATLDASDALAVAVCHYFQHKMDAGSVQTSGKVGKWEQFIKNNPNRIKK